MLSGVWAMHGYKFPRTTLRLKRIQLWWCTNITPKKFFNVCLLSAAVAARTALNLVNLLHLSCSRKLRKTPIKISDFVSHEPDSSDGNQESFGFKSPSHDSVGILQVAVWWDLDVSWFDKIDEVNSENPPFEVLKYLPFYRTGALCIRLPVTHSLAIYFSTCFEDEIVLQILGG
jgi:hypothetical protein